MPTLLHLFAMRSDHPTVSVNTRLRKSCMARTTLTSATPPSQLTDVSYLRFEHVDAELAECDSDGGGGAVLFCCTTGKHRSAAAAACYLVRSTRVSAATVMRSVASASQEQRGAKSAARFHEEPRPHWGKGNFPPLAPLVRAAYTMSHGPVVVELSLTL